MIAFDSGDQGSICTLVSLEFSASCAMVIKIKTRPIDRDIFLYMLHLVCTEIRLAFNSKYFS